MPIVTRVGDWTLREPLGRGGLGDVWVGQDDRSHRRVAVKVLCRAGASERALRDFLNEVRAAAALDHPNVVRILDQGRVRERGTFPVGTPWLAMELADRSLGQRTPASWTTVRHILLSILDALAHLHARGWVHRDLKPSNLLVCGSGPAPRVMVADFGLGHLAAEATDTGTAGSGTPRYMAPEQHLGRWRDLGPWTDLYALGGIAWQLVCGQHAFGAVAPGVLRSEHLRGELPPFDPSLPVPEGLDTWLRRLLAKRPCDRYTTAAEAAFVLRGLGDVGGGRVTTAPSGEPLRRPASSAPSDGGEPTIVLEDGARGGGSVPRTAPPRPAPARLPLPETWTDGPHHPIAPTVGLWASRTPALVGREAERGRIWSALRDVASTGRPRLLLLEGPTGIGKSHLVARACERAAEVGAATVVAATHDAHRGPGTGIVHALTRALRCGGLSRALAAEHLGRWAREWTGDDADDDAEQLAELVLCETPIDVRARYATLVAWLRRLAADRPLIVALDDAHYDAEACVVALRLLGEDLSVLLLATVAPEDLADRPVVAALVDRLRAHAAATTIRLGPLDAGSAVGLVRDRLGLEPALAARIALRSGGNPLLAVELVRDCVERQVLVPGPAGLALAGPDAELPVGLRAVWRATAARLVEGRAPSEVQGIRAAAALGPDVDPAAWAAVCAELGAPATAELADTLCERGLAVAGPDGVGAGWSFVHGLLGEALLEGPDARSVHVACAAVLGRSGGPEARERRAMHLLAAGRPEEALADLLEAAAFRWRTGDLALVEALLDTWRRTAEALPLASADPRWAPGWILLAGAARIQHRLDEAQRWASRAREAAVRHGWGPAEVNAVAELASIARAGGRADQARELLREALDAAEARGDAGRTVMVRADLAELLNDHGRPTEAMSMHRQNAAFHEATGDRWLEGRARFGMGFAALELADLDGAEEHLRACIDVLEPAAAVYGIRLARALLARIADLRGDLATAERLHGEAVGSVVPGQDPTAIVRWYAVRLRTGTVDGPAVSVLLEHGIPDDACACTHAWALVCVAGTRRWDLWPRRHDVLVGRVDREGALWSELPQAATIAGNLAARENEPLRARMAWALAERWWTRLGQPERFHRGPV